MSRYSMKTQYKEKISCCIRTFISIILIVFGIYNLFNPVILYAVITFWPHFIPNVITLVYYTRLIAIIIMIIGGILLFGGE
jgi:uncharacterized membrane protein